jgi:putative hydrolase
MDPGGKDHSVNQSVADRLREAAGLLEEQRANPFRVGAYRKAASGLAALDRDLREIFDAEGTEGLVALPHVGRGIAAAIVEILTTGRWGQLERLRGSLEPERVFRAVPGLGPRLSREIHDSLHVDSLEALESAAHDGRLEEVPGVGPRRAAAIRASLESMLGRVRRPPLPSGEGPAVGVLLDVDREYRDGAAEDTLPTITPRRFNPDGSLRLPILHTTRGPWHFTALFSNTARAHGLGRTRDWVVIYFYDDSHAEGQHTVVTEGGGALVGRRVVRGREQECRRHYDSETQSPP